MATLRELISTDLATVYDESLGFAQSVTGPGGAFLALFSNEYYQSDAGSVVVSTSVPVLRCRDADALDQGDTVTVGVVAYVVVEVKPDGYGETIHRLQLV